MHKFKISDLINVIVIVLLLTFISLYLQRDLILMNVNAEDSKEPNIELTNQSYVNVDSIFGQYMSVVDETLYYSMTAIDSNSLIEIFGKRNTPMFNKALECINPCMAFATTWGEAGSSYPGVSMTTVMDFNPNTYVDSIDWLNIAGNLEQVDTQWYCVNTKNNFNTNETGEAFHIANSLLQVPKDGDRSTSTMEDLGVGSFQITSNDWEKWDLNTRVNPIYGYYASLQKVGDAWIDCDVRPISDLTVYACLSLGHQGGNLITYEFGKELINIINTPEVQDAFNKVGYQMYEDVWFKALSKDVSLADINIGVYLKELESLSGIDFSNYTGGPGRTNKGNYVAQHCLRYCFYKNYFTKGNDNSLYDKSHILEIEIDNKDALAAQSGYVYGTHEHVAYKQKDFIKDINMNTSIAGAGCGWCSLTSAMAELNPTMCGGLSPVDWLETEMKAVGESYWGEGGMSWSGPYKWIEVINNIGLYGFYEIIDEGAGVPSSSVKNAISKYADDNDKVVIISAAPGLFTGGGHIMCVTDLSDDKQSFHIADSSTKASNYLELEWEDMKNYNFPLDVDNINGYEYNFKCYWVIQRKDM